MLLEVENLRVRYGNVEALHGINLQVQQGEIVTLLGANGAGKTTTLHAISGLLRPASGEIRFESRPIHKLPAHHLVEMGIAQAPEGRRIELGFRGDANRVVAAMEELRAGVRALGFGWDERPPIR